MVVQLLIPVKQRLQTDVSREAFIADPTAWDKFKDGVAAALGNSPRGVPYSRENVIIDSISAVTAQRRSLLQRQGLIAVAAGYGDVTEERRRQLAAGSTLEISYWISLIEQNVNPDTYTASPAFTAHLAAIVASLSSPAARSSIAASLAASSTAMQVTALPASIASSPSDVVVKVLQGPPTAAPTIATADTASSSDTLDALISGWPRYAVFAAVFVAGYVLVVCLVRCLRRLRLRATKVAQAQAHACVDVSKSPSSSSSASVSPEEARPGTRLVATGAHTGIDMHSSTDKVTFHAAVGGGTPGTEADAAGKWGAGQLAAEADADTEAEAAAEADADAAADYAIDVREPEGAIEIAPPAASSSPSNVGSGDSGGDGRGDNDAQAGASASDNDTASHSEESDESSAHSDDDEEEASAAALSLAIDAGTKVSAAAEREASLLEQRHQRAAAMFERVCGASEFADGSRQVLLVAHSDLGASSEVIAYVFGAANDDIAVVDDDNDGDGKTGGALLQPRKITLHQYQDHHRSGIPVPAPVPASVVVSDAETRSRYRVERVSDDERDYPGVTEMPVPRCIAAKHPAYAQSTGRLLGAVNLPLLMRDVIIDIWGVPGDDAAVAGAVGPRWATATVDGVAYAVLERLCIGSDSELTGSGGGGGGIGEVQMFARHPRSSMLVLERYSDQ